MPSALISCPRRAGRVDDRNGAARRRATDRREGHTLNALNVNIGGRRLPGQQHRGQARLGERYQSLAGHGLAAAEHQIAQCLLMVRSRSFAAAPVFEIIELPTNSFEPACQLGDRSRMLVIKCSNVVSGGGRGRLRIIRQRCALGYAATWRQSRGQKGALANPTSANINGHLIPFVLGATAR